MNDFPCLILGSILLVLAVLFSVVVFCEALEAEYAEYIQLCQDNGYTELQCELRYKELQMSSSHSYTAKSNTFRVN